MDYYKIGRNIRRYRKLKGLSQEQLAERINISVTHMSHIETGNTKLSLPVLIDIAEVFNIPIDELVYDRNECEKSRAVEEISLLLSTCSDKELSFITEMIMNIKLITDKYLKL